MSAPPRQRACPSAGSGLRRSQGGRARGRADQRGLTLIEILVVLFLILLMFGGAAMSMGAAGQAEVYRTTNQLAATVRFTYDRARFTGAHYRIHVDFEARSFQIQRAEQAMYLPATDRNGEIFLPDQKQLEAQAERDAQAAESYYSSVAAAYLGAAGEDNPYAVAQKDVPRARKPLFEAFEADGTLGELSKPIMFSEDVEIVSVQTDADVEPITKGEADLYFFPRGQTQLAHIQLRGEEDVEYTIIVQPLTGKVRVESGLIDLELPQVIGSGKDDLGAKLERRSF